MEAVRDYIVHTDSKKRITLHGATYQYYNVKEYKNGSIMFEPRELEVPETISTRTLENMDKRLLTSRKVMYRGQLTFPIS